jgi:uncharacterized protein YggE
MKLFRLAVVGAALAAVVVFAGVGRPDAANSDSSPSTNPRTITVTGSGSVSATPTRAVFEFGVGTRGKTAVQALNDDSAQMRKLIAALEGAGIPADSLQTSSVSLSPVTSEDGTAIVGYTASNSVSVTLRGLGKVGSTIDAAVEAGANQVSGPNLVRSDATALYRAALRAAITNAKGKAQTISRASGLHIRRITDVSESSAAPAPTPLTSKAAGDVSTPVEAGTTLVEATVTVTFGVS